MELVTFEDLSGVVILLYGPVCTLAAFLVRREKRAKLAAHPIDNAFEGLRNVLVA